MQAPRHRYASVLLDAGESIKTLYSYLATSGTRFSPSRATSDGLILVPPDTSVVLTRSRSLGRCCRPSSRLLGVGRYVRKGLQGR